MTQRMPIKSAVVFLLFPAIHVFYDINMETSSSIAMMYNNTNETKIMYEFIIHYV